VATLSPELIKQAKNVPANFIFNVMDGGFFGLALGFASFSTVLPLFVSSLTHSAVLIGMIPAIHTVGWYLPQVFTAQRVSQLKRYKPMVMFWTIHERVPFLGLALVAWFVPQIGPTIALLLTFTLLVWQGIGGGMAANPWQNMIGKIIPRERWGIFFGSQTAASTLLGAVGVFFAGLVMQNNLPNAGFSMCFLLAIGAFSISFIALGLTREVETPAVASGIERKDFWHDIRGILQRDDNFRWFVAARIMAQVGTAGFAFYTVYIVEYYGVNAVTVGIMGMILYASQTIFNPILGWLGDHWSHRGVMTLGMAAAAVSAGITIWAPSIGWFYLAYALAGIAYVGIWTIALPMIQGFGQAHEKPSYIGLANTLIAPTAFFIPIIAGLLADSAGYKATFLATAIGAVATGFILVFILKDHPKPVMIGEY
jgi:MFS family permease